jgi:hypothetical protein
METRKPAGTASHTWRHRQVLAMLATMLAACTSCAVIIDDGMSGRVAAVHEPSPWREVFAGLALRADHGDAQAARLAIEMVRTAPQVYGESFDATREQLRRWHARALTGDALCLALRCSPLVRPGRLVDETSPCQRAVPCG